MISLNTRWWHVHAVHCVIQIMDIDLDDSWNLELMHFSFQRARVLLAFCPNSLPWSIHIWASQWTATQWRGWISKTFWPSCTWRSLLTEWVWVSRSVAGRITQPTAIRSPRPSKITTTAATTATTATMARDQHRQAHRRHSLRIYSDLQFLRGPRPMGPGMVSDSDSVRQCIFFSDFDDSDNFYAGLSPWLLAVTFLAAF